MVLKQQREEDRKSKISKVSNIRTIYLCCPDQHYPILDSSFLPRNPEYNCEFLYWHSSFPGCTCVHVRLRVSKPQLSLHLW